MKKNLLTVTLIFFTTALVAQEIDQSTGCKLITPNEINSQEPKLKGEIITAAAYCNFLNAVGTKEDSHHLYLPIMEKQILQTGEDGCYNYSLVNGEEPLLGLPLANAMRYCNWLENGSLLDGNNEATAIASTETGAYELKNNQVISTHSKAIYNVVDNGDGTFAVTTASPLSSPLMMFGDVEEKPPGEEKLDPRIVNQHEANIGNSAAFQRGNFSDGIAENPPDIANDNTSRINTSMISELARKTSKKTGSRTFLAKAGALFAGIVGEKMVSSTMQSQEQRRAQPPIIAYPKVDSSTINQKFILPNFADRNNFTLQRGSNNNFQKAVKASLVPAISINIASLLNNKPPTIENRPEAQQSFITHILFSNFSINTRASTAKASMLSLNLLFRNALLAKTADIRNTFSQLGNKVLGMNRFVAYCDADAPENSAQELLEKVKNANAIDDEAYAKAAAVQGEEAVQLWKVAIEKAEDVVKAQDKYIAFLNNELTKAPTKEAKKAWEEELAKANSMRNYRASNVLNKKVAHADAIENVAHANAAAAQGEERVILWAEAIKKAEDILAACDNWIDSLNNGLTKAPTKEAKKAWEEELAKANSMRNYGAAFNVLTKKVAHADAIENVAHANAAAAQGEEAVQLWKVAIEKAEDVVKAQDKYIAFLNNELTKAPTKEAKKAWEEELAKANSMRNYRASNVLNKKVAHAAAIDDVAHANAAAAQGEEKVILWAEAIKRAEDVLAACDNCIAFLKNGLTKAPTKEAKEEWKKELADAKNIRLVLTSNVFEKKIAHADAIDDVAHANAAAAQGEEKVILWAEAIKRAEDVLAAYDNCIAFLKNGLTKAPTKEAKEEWKKELAAKNCEHLNAQCRKLAYDVAITSIKAIIANGTNSLALWNKAIEICEKRKELKADEIKLIEENLKTTTDTSTKLELDKKIKSLQNFNLWTDSDIYEIRAYKTIYDDSYATEQDACDAITAAAKKYILFLSDALSIASENDKEEWCEKLKISQKRSFIYLYYLSKAKKAELATDSYIFNFFRIKYVSNDANKLAEEAWEKAGKHSYDWKSQSYTQYRTNLWSIKSLQDEVQIIDNLIREEFKSYSSIDWDNKTNNDWKSKKETIEKLLIAIQGIIKNCKQGRDKALDEADDSYKFWNVKQKKHEEFYDYWSNIDTHINNYIKITRNASKDDIDKLEQFLPQKKQQFENIHEIDESEIYLRNDQIYSQHRPWQIKIMNKNTHSIDNHLEQVDKEWSNVETYFQLMHDKKKEVESTSQEKDEIEKRKKFTGNIDPKEQTVSDDVINLVMIPRVRKMLIPYFPLFIIDSMISKTETINTIDLSKIEVEIKNAKNKHDYAQWEFRSAAKTFYQAMDEAKKQEAKAMRYITAMLCNTKDDLTDKIHFYDQQANEEENKRRGAFSKEKKIKSQVLNARLKFMIARQDFEEEQSFYKRIKLKSNDAIDNNISAQDYCYHIINELDRSDKDLKIAEEALTKADDNFKIAQKEADDLKYALDIRKAIRKMEQAQAMAKAYRDEEKRRHMNDINSIKDDELNKKNIFYDKLIGEAEDQLNDAIYKKNAIKNNVLSAELKRLCFYLYFTYIQFRKEQAKIKKDNFLASYQKVSPDAITIFNKIEEDYPKVYHELAEAEKAVEAVKKERANLIITSQHAIRAANLKIEQVIAIAKIYRNEYNKRYWESVWKPIESTWEVIRKYIPGHN